MENPPVSDDAAAAVPPSPSPAPVPEPVPAVPCPCPAPAAPAPAAPPCRPSRWKGCLIAGVLVALCGGALLLLAGIGLVVAVIWGSSVGEIARPAPVRQELIEGTMFAHKKIAVIDIKGVIRGGALHEGASAETICEELKAAEEDPAVAAVILDMDTPGGEVTASDEIHHAVLRLSNSGKPVVTCMRSMGASGGYFIAAASDHIIANRLTLTGSIGVIISTINYAGLLDKIGVKDETYRSGAMKDMLNGGRARTPEEAEYVNSLVRKTFLEFVKVVADGRADGYKNTDAVLKAPFADGRVLSGQDALDLKLVDELGYFEDAVEAARDLGEAPDAKVVRFQRSMGLADLLFSMRSSLKPMGLLSLTQPDPAFQPRPGQLYYILPAYVP